MNKLQYIFTATIASLGLMSCDDILDVNSTTQVSDVAIWSNEEAAEGYVIASYQTFCDHSYMYGGGVNKFYDAYSDLMKSTSWDQYEHMYNKTLFQTTIFGKSNGGQFGVWGTEYGRIKRANILLNDIDRYGVAKFGEEWCEVRRAEVRFCNAINYFFLARAYGGVVLRTHNSGKTGLTDDGAYPEDCNRARLTEEETYDYIISEIQWAIERLPETWVNEKYGEKYNGRATKGMAYGFLSRIALYAKKWDIAVDAANKCKQYGKYELVSNYANLFNSNYANENRKEIIYGIYGLKKYRVHDYEMHMRPFGDGATHNAPIAAHIVPTAELADMYEWKNGTDFNWKRWSIGHKDPYTDREPRFHATILYNGAKWENRTIETWTTADGKEKGADYFVEYKNALATNGHTCTGYYMKKYLIENNDEFTTEHCWNTDIVLRYAEVLLNKAEGLAEQGDLQGALNAINEVRARVDLPAKTLANYPDKDAVMTLLRKERCCELAGEGLRYWDLRRWNMAHTAIDGQSVNGVKVTKQVNGSFAYETVDADGGLKRIFQQRYYYYSIPSDELTNNKLCVDNPGW